MSAVAATGDGLDRAMGDAVAALRLAIINSWKAPASHVTVGASLDDTDAALGHLRHAVELAALVSMRVARTYHAFSNPPRLRVREDGLPLLRHEPNNPADANAAAVHARCGTRVGHLPRGDSVGLAPHLDAGM